MTDFNDAETKALIKKKRTCDGITYLFIGILIIAAVIAAILSKREYESSLGVDYPYLSALIVAAMFLLVLIFHLIFFVNRTKEQLNYAVAKRIANGFINNSQILEGGGTAEFEVTYEGDLFTVTRLNFKRKQATLPVLVTKSGILNEAVANFIRFDISALKSLPAVYGAFGTRVWAFIQAYYAVNGGFDAVTVTDKTGNKNATLAVVKDGKPCETAKKNYFIKRGLVK